MIELIWHTLIIVTMIKECMVYKKNIFSTAIFFFVQPAEIELENKFYICDSESRDIALGILYGYKALLQVLALILSFSIGKVKIKGLNDAKYITVAVYVTSIVTAVIFVSLYSLKTYLNLYASLFSFGFFVGTTVILALVFLPKVRVKI